MRKGYWKILLRRLRSRVATGFDSFRFHGLTVTVTEVLASDDDALDPAAVLPLAATASGAVFLIDTGSNLVLLRAEDGQSCGLDLPAFIDALEARKADTPSMDLSLGDAEELDLSLPQRKPLLGD